MAEASRTLITRAEIDSNLNATTKAGTITVDGTTMAFGSTGLRDITGLAVAGVVASGRILVERIGPYVTWYLENLVLATGDGTTNVSVISTGTALAGFRPKKPEYKTHLLSGTTGQLCRIAVTATPQLQINWGRAGVSMSGLVGFTTEAGMPSVLPGVADGETVAI